MSGMLIGYARVPVSGMLIGYARVSTDEPDLTAQRNDLVSLASRPSASTSITGYVDGYYRPHSGLAHRTPREVAATWQDHHDDLIPSA